MTKEIASGLYFYNAGTKIENTIKNNFKSAWITILRKNNFLICILGL